MENDFYKKKLKVRAHEAESREMKESSIARERERQRNKLWQISADCKRNKDIVMERGILLRGEKKGETETRHKRAHRA